MEADQHDHHRRRQQVRRPWEPPGFWRSAESPGRPPVQGGGAAQDDQAPGSPDGDRPPEQKEREKRRRRRQREQGQDHPYEGPAPGGLVHQALAARASRQPASVKNRVATARMGKAPIA